MSNSTSDWDWSAMMLYIGYTVEGLFISCSHFFIILCMASFSALRCRNSFLMIMGLALADAINSLAYLSAGLYRSYILLVGRKNEPINILDCITKPFSVIWPFSEAIAALMLALVSLDRLLSVLFPLQYIGWSRSYAYGTVGSAYALCLLVAVVGFYLPAYTNDLSQVTVPEICYASRTFEYLHEFYLSYYWNATQVYALISVVLYLLVWIVYSLKQQTLALAQGQQKIDMRHQRRLTNTLAISCAFTFVCVIVGTRVGSWMAQLGHHKLGMACYLLFNLNPALNALIYPTRHEEIRMACVAFLRGKHMPDDLRLWKTNAQALSVGPKSTNTEQRPKGRARPEVKPAAGVGPHRKSMMVTAHA